MMKLNIGTLITNYCN